jgi:hypothetical protein
MLHFDSVNSFQKKIIGQLCFGRPKSINEKRKTFHTKNEKPKNQKNLKKKNSLKCLNPFAFSTTHSRLPAFNLQSHLPCTAVFRCQLRREEHEIHHMLATVEFSRMLNAL